ncbi:MAG: hypothetical protein MUD00_00880 [Candidatus Pacebacteria bacterium]|jgi:hypothetical protein|nr:hypothetical protein [Candidatus Paceibacterota bacterium]
MTSKFKILLTLIAAIAIVIIVVLIHRGPRGTVNRSDTQTGQAENNTSTIHAELPRATGSVNDLFEAIDRSTGNEDQYAASETDQIPADDTTGFDQSINENSI